MLAPALVSAKTAAKEKPQAQTGNLLTSFTGGESGKSMINIVLVLTVLAFAPAILLLMSSFTRIVIVLSILRQAMGIPQLPPNQIIVGLSLFLTFFVMAPTYEKINANALAPYMNNQITFEEFIDKGSKEMNIFMLKYTKEKDLALFMNIASLGETEDTGRDTDPGHCACLCYQRTQTGFSDRLFALHTISDD